MESIASKGITIRWEAEIEFDLIIFEENNYHN
jgi:hypothetical protein